MAEERKKAIEKAKLLQYYETDRIKTFHVRQLPILLHMFSRLPVYKCYFSKTENFAKISFKRKLKMAYIYNLSKYLQERVKIKRSAQRTRGTDRAEESSGET